MRKLIIPLLAIPIIFGTTSCKLLISERKTDLTNIGFARISYGRFLNYLDDGKVKSVDIFDGGRTAFVETTDSDLDNKVQRLRVDLPGLTPELINNLKNKGISFDVYPASSSTNIGLFEKLINNKSDNQSIKVIKYSEFIEAVQNKEVSKVLLSPDNGTAQIVENDGSRSQVYLAPDKDLLKILTENNVDIAVKPTRIVRTNPLREFLNYFFK